MALTDACIVTIVTKSAGQPSEAEAAAVAAAVALADKHLRNNRAHNLLCARLFFIQPQPSFIDYKIAILNIFKAVLARADIIVGIGLKVIFAFKAG